MSSSPPKKEQASPVPPAPKVKSTQADAKKQENQDILNSILPPRYHKCVSQHLKFVIRVFNLNAPSNIITSGNGWRTISCTYSRCPVQCPHEQMSFTWKSFWTQRSSRGRPEKQESVPSAGSFTPNASVRMATCCRGSSPPSDLQHVASFLTDPPPKIFFK